MPQAGQVQWCEEVIFLCEPNESFREITVHSVIQDLCWCLMELIILFISVRLAADRFNIINSIISNYKFVLMLCSTFYISTS